MPPSSAATTADVTASGSTASTVDAATDHGRVRLELAAVPTSVTARSDHGDVTVVVPPTATTPTPSTPAPTTAAANVGMKDDPSAPRTIDAHSDHGDVSVTYPSG